MTFFTFDVLFIANPRTQIETGQTRAIQPTLSVKSTDKI